MSQKLFSDDIDQIRLVNREKKLSMKRLTLSQNFLASLVIISFSIATALLSWSYKARFQIKKTRVLTVIYFRVEKIVEAESKKRKFIGVFVFILSLINLLFAFFHLFAWGMVVEQAGHYFLGSALIGILIQMFLAITGILKFFCKSIPSCEK